MVLFAISFVDGLTTSSPKPFFRLSAFMKMLVIPSSKIHVSVSVLKFIFLEQLLLTRLLQTVSLFYPHNPHYSLIKNLNPLT